MSKVRLNSFGSIKSGNRPFFVKSLNKFLCCTFCEIEGRKNEVWSGMRGTNKDAEILLNFGGRMEKQISQLTSHNSENRVEV